MTYPNVPIKSAGTISSVQPFETAIAAAEVGPPTLAFDAIIISSILNLNIFPSISENIRLTRIIMKANTNSNGDSLRIKPIEAGAPITAKNR